MRRTKILLVDDEPEICGLLSCLFEREGYEPLVAYNGISALNRLRREAPDVLMVDLRLPDIDGLEVLRGAKAFDQDLPVVIMTAHGDIAGAVDAMRASAHDYLTKPFDHGKILTVVKEAIAERELRLNGRPRLGSDGGSADLGEIMGHSEFIRRIADEVACVARSDLSVVVIGETGSGKEVVARAIHAASPRAARAFVPMDCGAIPENLFEAELFGHARGAYTGAVSPQAGKVVSACGGTLFLDEIANMPLGLQAKLLRVLQEKTVYPLGGGKGVKVDVRILAASNADLQASAAAGRFRPDLLFRLSEFVIRVPPLRERREDIAHLAGRFLGLANGELGKRVRGFTVDALERLVACAWPGNVRQLRSTVRRAVLLASDLIAGNHLDILDGGNAKPEPRSGVDRDRAVLTPGSSLREIVAREAESVEQDVLRSALREARGNKAKAARQLRIDYKTIQCKLRKYGISP